MNHFHIEQSEKYIILYINGGLSRRIVKEKCSIEQQLNIVMEWLDELNLHSSFFMGSSVYMKMTNEEFDHKLVCKRYGGYNLKYSDYLYFEDDCYWDCCDYNAIMSPDAGWTLSNIQIIISDPE